MTQLVMEPRTRRAITTPAITAELPARDSMSWSLLAMTTSSPSWDSMPQSVSWGQTQPRTG